MADSSAADLECGGECFSDAAEEEGSCFYSTYGDDPEMEGEGGRECRICHLSLDSDGGDAIELGCCCKDDLAAAHKHCAETWFKIKGNKTCEICNSTVSNLNEMAMPSTTHGAIIDANPEATTTSTHSSSTTRGGVRGGGCINGHRLLNFILACLVFAFVISWLFHFNIPS